MEENVENVVEETTQPTEQVEETKFESAGDDSVLKVDLSKPPTPKEEIKNEPEKEVAEKVAEDNTDDSGVVELVEDADTTEKQEEVQPQAETQEQPVLEEITEEEVQEQTEGLKEEVLEAAEEAEKTGMPLPENLQKVVDFM